MTFVEDTVSSENAAARAMMQRVVAAMQPVVDRMIDNEYRLLPGADVGIEEVRTAVFMATGKYVREFVPVGHAELASEGGKIGFSLTFDRAIELLCGFRLVTALGSRKWGSHRRHFGYEEAVPLFQALRPDPGKLPRECFRATLFYYWGFALARNDAMIDRLSPIIALLPKAVPIGELAGRPGTWLVLVA